MLFPEFCGRVGFAQECIPICIPFSMDVPINKAAFSTANFSTLALSYSLSFFEFVPCETLSVSPRIPAEYRRPKHKSERTTGRGFRETRGRPSASSLEWRSIACIAVSERVRTTDVSHRIQNFERGMHISSLGFLLDSAG